LLLELESGSLLKLDLEAALVRFSLKFVGLRRLSTNGKATGEHAQKYAP
jgi:hypothetical protein